MDPQPSAQRPTTLYAELHAHSSFTFSHSAATPQHMVETAWKAGLSTIALLERDGLYSAVQVAETVRDLTEDMQAGLLPHRSPLGTAFGAELTLSSTHQRDDPTAEIVPILVRNVDGYRALSHLIGEAYLRAGDKDHVHYDQSELLDFVRAGHCWVLTGGPGSLLRQALDSSGITDAAAELTRCITRYGADNVVVELVYSGRMGECERNDALVEICESHQPPVAYIATSCPAMGTPREGRTAAAVQALGAYRTVEENAGYIHPGGAAFLHTPQEMSTLAGPHQRALTAAARIGTECAFNLHLVSPGLPPFSVPPGEDENSYLRALTLAGARRRYRGKDSEEAALQQITYELEIIRQLDFPGYFLIVNDIVQFCRDHHILCQGRGSAANSAVCYCLGITAVDPIANQLLFERFLSPERDGPPDIDVDIESQRREDVIQYVYRRYGRRNAAQVANVITYRQRSAVRDAARALGYPPGQQDAWSKKVSRLYSIPHATEQDPDPCAGIPPLVQSLAAGFHRIPQHMSIHSGGMVICDRPVTDVVPVEWGRRPGRSVVQWDKDDCAAVGLVKFDLLGLGILTALRHCLDLLKEEKEDDKELTDIPMDDPAVYRMLQQADTVGVFQVESRAQMNTLPRLRPRNFFDLVVEVALVRPGPIQGNSVHPYIRRRNGSEPVTFDHPCLEAALGKTLGIPLFQEQLMEIAQAAAGFNGGEADQLRRAIGSKRSAEKMERIKARFFAGMRERHGIGAAPGEAPGPLAEPDWQPCPREIGERLWEKMKAFSAYGFPESHAQSFASLVYYSAWFKCHYPAIYCAALLRSQPMGFYSPQSLVQDAQRHGVRVHPVDIHHSDVEATCEQHGEELRLGLTSVRGFGKDPASRLVTARQEDGPFSSIADLVLRAGLTTEQVESLALAGALDCLTQQQGGAGRHEALWRAGVEAQTHPAYLPGITVTTAPHLPGMSAWEIAMADYVSTGISTYPTVFLRKSLTEQGVTCARDLFAQPNGQRVRIAGVVTHRQRPPSAGGVTFLSMEDETGLMNVICSAGLWKRYRAILTQSTALVVRGLVDSAEGAVSIVADKIEPLDVGWVVPSRDFR
ncbi:error-prone DNA polymerase [Lawsonella clevelandensis]|uniref:Error-prone DNA polymerase n=1 Tax=Lawsonella clevelandensis TaxID=1528099 RepID=A0A5E3ZW20_9ACTN|nr:error-prone DNA polymerase [Lawsonella clevelandensis]VHO00149.1 Error-prone DNA polymerase [Lawsonella clevelandensis]